MLFNGVHCVLFVVWRLLCGGGCCLLLCDNVLLVACCLLCAVLHNVFAVCRLMCAVCGLLLLIAD